MKKFTKVSIVSALAVAVFMGGCLTFIKGIQDKTTFSTDYPVVLHRLTGSEKEKLATFDSSSTSTNMANCQLFQKSYKTEYPDSGEVSCTVVDHQGNPRALLTQPMGAKPK